MGFDPNLILYACVAKDTIVLAEFNSKDHQDLGSLALECLTKTPSFHSNFSHTIRGKTYTFLIQEPFTYFTISDENLENFDVLSFLDSVKVAFGNVGDSSWTERKLDSLGSHCFQGEFNPVFHQLLSISNDMQSAMQRDMQGPSSRRMGMTLNERSSSSLESGRGRQKIGRVPLLVGHGLFKKKTNMWQLFWVGNNKGGGERKVDVDNDNDDDDDDEEEEEDSMHKGDGYRNRGVSMNQRRLSGFVDPVMLRDAKRSWKKHVWIVLSLDLFICLSLFSVWLWVCRGFKCING